MYRRESLDLSYLTSAELELDHLFVGAVREHWRQLAEGLARRLAQPQQVIVQPLAEDVRLHDGGLLTSCLFE